MELINTVVSMSAIVICCILGWAVDSQSKTIKVLKSRLSRLEYSDFLIKKNQEHSNERISSMIRRLDKKPVDRRRSVTELIAENEKLKYDNSLLTLALKQADNNLGTYCYAGVDMSEGKDMTIEAHFNEKGEIIGAEAVEPFVQEGGEIEGFNSQVVREGQSYKIPNRDGVFEMLSKTNSPGAIESLKEQAQEMADKEPKIEYPFRECDYCNRTGRDFMNQAQKCPKCHGSGKLLPLPNGYKEASNHTIFWRELTFTQQDMLRSKHRFNRTGELESHEIEEIYNLERSKTK